MIIVLTKENVTTMYFSTYWKWWKKGKSSAILQLSLQVKHKAVDYRGGVKGKLCIQFIAACSLNFILTIYSAVFAFTVGVRGNEGKSKEAMITYLLRISKSHTSLWDFLPHKVTSYSTAWLQKLVIRNIFVCVDLQEKWMENYVGGAMFEAQMAGSGGNVVCK